MARTKSKSQPTWTDVKAKLVHFDRAGLLGLIQDLYGASKENRMFLHTRFDLGEDALKPYKATINRWLSPDVLRNQDVSAAKAKQAISDYKKAIGELAGLAELMVFYCECAAGFCAEFGCVDLGYLNALARRLEGVGEVAQDIGYGVGDHIDFLLANYFDDPD